LQKKAPDYKCECRPDTKKREWLYDLVWRKFDSGDYLSTLLAMEIEVSAGYKGVVYDFNKLLQSDAKLKIMVFQQKTVEEGEDILNKLNSKISKYKHTFSSSYLLVCWVKSEYKFIFSDELEY